MMSAAGPSDSGYNVFMELNLRRVRVVSNRARVRRPVGWIQHRRHQFRWGKPSSRHARQGHWRGHSGSVTSSADEGQSHSSGDTPKSKTHSEEGSIRRMVDWHLLLERELTDTDRQLTMSPCHSGYKEPNNMDMPNIDTAKPLGSYQECRNGRPCVDTMYSALSSQTVAAPSESASPSLTRDSSFIRCYGPGVGNHLYWDCSSPADWDYLRTVTKDTDSTDLGAGSRANRAVALASPELHRVRLAFETLVQNERETS